MELDVKITQSGKLSNLFLLSRSSAMQQRILEAVNAAAEDGAEMIRADTPVKSGDLKESIQAAPAEQDADGVYSAKIGTKVKYAPWIEYGKRKGVQKIVPFAMFRKNIGNIKRALNRELIRALRDTLG